LISLLQKNFSTLFLIDGEICADEKQKGCPYCGSILDRADYTRKPRGGPKSLSDENNKRFSLCCRKDGCRKRLTPASIRFLGRRVYFSVVIIVATVLVSGPNAKRLSQINEYLSVKIDRKTMKEWRRWWSDVFPKNAHWQKIKSLFIPPIDEGILPGSLVYSFSSRDPPNEHEIIKILKILSNVGF